ncbi:GntR family transcriptional regulator [Agrobacterium deltaense]
MNTITTLSGQAPELDSMTDEAEVSVYERLRDDIIQGRLKANERLKVTDLANRMGTSTNPVREALQQLRGEGFVIMAPNRGARVRPIDEDFVRDICEIEVLIEPALTRWFVGIATRADIDALEELQRQIEDLNFADEAKHSALDLQFHQVMYNRHYNRHAVDLWVRHRQILGAISRQFSTSVKRQRDVVDEHKELLRCLKTHDADAASAAIAKHVSGSGAHIIEHMRVSRHAGLGS